MSERIKSSIRCIRELGIEVDDIVFSPLAASRAVLTQDQKDEDSLLLDIGAGTTEFILYIDGEVRQSGVLAIGGDFVTHDLSHHFHIPFAAAESLKIGYGNALIGQHPVDEPVPPDHFPAPAGRAIGREELNAIIHARTWNIIEMLIEHLGPELDTRSLRAGLFLTGGTSELKGIRQLFEAAFEIPVHLIHEQPAAGYGGVFQNPQFSTALGLLCLS